MASCCFKRPVRWVGVNGEEYVTLVPCGRCLDCLKHQSSDWVFRLNQEHNISKQSVFITLTYDNQNLPKDNNLHYKDCQHFFKRLRHHFSFRYFVIGEYGYNGTNRPHYHAILFLPERSNNCTLDTISKVWNKGLVSFDPVTAGRIKYVAGYSSLSDVMRHRVRPFRHMSLRSAIGFNFVFTDAFRKCLDANKWTFKLGATGRTVLVPRYYKRYVQNNGYVIPYTLTLTGSNVRSKGLSTDVEPRIEIDINDLSLRTAFASEADYRRYTAPYRKISDRFYIPESYYRRHYGTYSKLVRSHSFRDNRQHIKIPYELWLLSYSRGDSDTVYRDFVGPSALLSRDFELIKLSDYKKITSRPDSTPYNYVDEEGYSIPSSFVFKSKPENVPPF